MSCGITEGVRDLEFGRESRVRFDDWEGLNEHEKLAAKAFEEGIENGFAQFPTTLHVGGNKADVVLSVLLGEAMGDNISWDFSLKDALTDLEWSDEEKAEMVDGLMAMAELVQSQIKTGMKRRTEVSTHVEKEQS